MSLKTNATKIIREHNLPANALYRRDRVLDGKTSAEKFEILWQAFADAVEWRSEEAELLDSLRAKVANQRTEFKAMNQTLNKLDAKLIEIEARGRYLADRADEIEGDAGD